MNKLFVDITELAGWQGKLTGVPRVMDEIVRRYNTGPEAVSFITWKPQGYTSVEYYSDKKERTELQDTLKSKKRSVPIRVVKKLYVKSRIVQKTVNVARGSMHKAAAELADMDTVQINNGDLLFILADWHGGDPSFVEYIKVSKTRGVKLIQMVYDMLPIVTPQYSGHSTEMLENYSTQVYPLCDLIFSISEHTKKDITKWLVAKKLNVPEINVVRLGDDFSRVKTRKPETDLPKDYILSVGTIEARKNHTLLYYTYKLAYEQKIKLPKIIIVGRVGWLAEDIYKIITTDPETKDSFLFLHGISDNELAWLYENCLFTVYPSFYEGWGLPIAESIAHGKTVIASNTSSMPEIAGDLISYFNPASADECLGYIKYLLVKDNLALETRKIEKYSPYSWDATYDIINKAINRLHK